MSSGSKCPICSLAATVQKDGGRDAFRISCRRCGDFGITGTAWNLPGRLDKGGQGRLSVATRRASDHGRLLQLDSSQIGPLTERQPLPVATKARLLLELLASRCEGIGSKAKLELDIDFPAIGATSPEELHVFVGFLESKGWTTYTPFLGEPPKREGSVAMTLDGWAELERPGEQEIVSGRVFVAISFKPELNPAYEDKILAEIALAEFVVADVTHHSQGVYFEAGYAMALGRPVVFTCREDHKADCHFDTQHYPHLFWKTPADLREQLASWLGALIGRRTPGRPA